MEFRNDLAFAQQLDQQDDLRHFRERFFMPQQHGKDKIYFTGNSLGLQPKAVRELMDEELDDWATMGGEGHFEARRPWYSYHELFPSLVAPLIGSKEKEIVIMNSLTLNLHLLLVSFYRPDKKRYKILCEYKAFPSDQYAFESQVKFHGLDPDDAIIEIKPREGEYLIRVEDILQAINDNRDSLALVILGGINYYSGQVFDMQKITAAAHAAGAIAGFDLAHAVGNISLQLHDWDVDFACWCTYKYLNSGPGSVGGAFIHERHISDASIPRFAGWWGYDKQTRFRMEKGFHPIPTAEGWQLSNAPVFSMAPHKVALDIFAEAGFDRLVRKSEAMVDYLRFILKDINTRFSSQPIAIITPEDKKQRGCQVSIVLRSNGRAIFDHLMKNGVSAGWREPEVLRVAPVPLYNSFEDIWQFGNLLEAALKNPVA